MLKLAVLLFVGLVRSLPKEDVTGKFTIATAGDSPYTNDCDDTDWAGALPDPETEPGSGTHDAPYYAALDGFVGSNPAAPRCGEMFALFKTTDSEFDGPPTYIMIANHNDINSYRLEIGAQACTDIGECTTTFGVALKLPQVTTVITQSPRSDVMCTEFDGTEGGDGTTIQAPIYVYVDVAVTFADHIDCGTVYGFGAKYVVVAGTTTAGVDEDGLDLAVAEGDCADVSACGLDGYAIWTGSTFVPVTTTGEVTTGEVTTVDEITTVTVDGETTTVDGLTTATVDGETTTVEEITTTATVEDITTTTVNTQTTTSTSSTTTETTTEETTTEADSTFFAAVGFTLLALLA